MNKQRVSIDRIKRLAIIALITDDYLMETLVLKGGNAMLMAYDLPPCQEPKQPHKPKTVTFPFTMKKYFSTFEP